MGGFPNVISRAALGPKLENEDPVANNKREIGAPEFNLAWWQLAGCNLMAPRCWAWLKGSDAGAFSQASLLGAAEAWDPDSAFGPTIARVSAGIYTVVYAATYPDVDDVQVPTALGLGWGQVLGATPNLVCVVERVDDRTLKARVTVANSAAPADADLIVFGR